MTKRRPRPCAPRPGSCSRWRGPRSIAYPTAALAYARKSLELADTPEARRFAVEVLSRGPVARILPVVKIAKELEGPESSDYVADLALSPDGNWLATASADNKQVLLFPRDGGAPRPCHGRPTGTRACSSSDRKATASSRADWARACASGRCPTYSRSVPPSWGASAPGARSGRKLLAFPQMFHQDREPLVRAWSFADGEPELLGKLDLEAATCSDIDPRASGWSSATVGASGCARSTLPGGRRNGSWGTSGTRAWASPSFPQAIAWLPLTGPARSGSGR